MSRTRQLNTTEKTAKQEKQYKDAATRVRPKPHYFVNAAKAFLVGGIICVVGQLFIALFTEVEHSKAEVIAVTQAFMILLGAVLTDFGIYDVLGEFSGMGAAVPITGFANTIVSAAIDFRREGWLAGLGCKMFAIAGPVLVYGIVSGISVGILSALFRIVFH